MLSQLTMLFGFFALVLVLVYWINRAVLIFDEMISDGQSAMMFLEFSALTLPYVIRLMLPVAAFAGAIYVTNRLQNESELVVMQAVGLSGFRLARPVLIFGLMVGLMVSILGHFLVPVSLTMLNDRTAKMGANVTSRILSDGKFIHPTDGITLFIRQITPLGEMRDVFLSDARSGDAQTIYSSRRALLVSVDSGPKLVMFDGMAQTLNRTDMKLATTRFTDFTYDIGGLLGTPAKRRVEVAELGTLDLLNPTPENMAATGGNPAQFFFEAHSRFASALTAAAAALLGFSTLLLGGFSRFGSGIQIIAAIIQLIVLQFMINAAADIAIHGPAYWPVVYVPPVIGLAVSAVYLWVSGRPRGRLQLRGGAPA